MKEKKIFTTVIVAKNEERAKELEGILRDEKISFFKEAGMFDFTNFKLHISWVDVKRLIKIRVFDTQRHDIILRTFY